VIQGDADEENRGNCCSFPTTAGGMTVDGLQELADLIRQRNAISKEITRIIGRPGLIGHLGEFIAATVFNIALETSAVNRGFDGRFKSGPLLGKSVNIKWYGKQEGLLDIRSDAVPDFYLVLTGPRTKVLHSRGDDRPWFIDSVFLFEAIPLVERLRARQVKLGVATSVRTEFWKLAEVFPSARNNSLPLSSEQCAMLSLFSSKACES
jgi:hypothetical protein